MTERAPPVPDWLQGLFAVLPTPMHAGGALDLASLDRLVDHYVAEGAAGLVPVSVAGEGGRLSEAERRSVIERVLRRVQGRVPVVAAVLDTGAAGALQQAQTAAQCGATGLLVMPPGAPPQAMHDHLAALGRALDLPMVLLDHPGIGPRLAPDLIVQLVEAVPRLAGIKLEDEPTAPKMAALRQRLGARLRIFGGLGGAHCLQELAHGADGFFTGLACPGLLVQVQAQFRRGDLPGARASFEALQAVALRERRHPGGMVGGRKAILHELGLLGDPAMR
jgi:4-hydroxy-tetrahydrodipicolinate synthase